MEPTVNDAKRAAPPQATLVAIDFSPSSRRALDLTLEWWPKSEVTALHVVDTEFAERVGAAGLASRGETIARLRARADEEFNWLGQEKGNAFSPMIVEGIPFLEIIRIAKDLDVDLVIMGTRRTSVRVGDL